MEKITRIFGIDPGLCCMGWGVIEVNGINLNFVASGTLKSNAKLSLSERLHELYQGLSETIKKYMPDEVAIEHIFVNRNGSTTLKLSQARGIALLVPAQSGIIVSEYSPQTIKKSVFGRGNANKKNLHIKIKSLISDAIFETKDAGDALAIAICHAKNKKIPNYII